MRRAGAIAGVLASLAILGFSAAINAQYGWALGRSPLDSRILAGASIGFDILKATLPFAIFAAWRESQWFRAAAGSLLWAAVVSYSLASSIGFSSLNRSDVTAERSQLSSRYEDLRTELNSLTATLDSPSGSERTSDAIGTDIGIMQLRPEFNATGGCAQASRPPSWCQSFLRLKGEMADARRREALTAKRDQLISQLAQMPAVSQSDPQASVIGDVVPLPLSTIRTCLVILIAICLELGSGVGVYVSVAMLDEPKNRKSDKSDDPINLEAFAAKIAESIRISIQSVDRSPSVPTEDIRLELTKPPLPRLATQDGKIVDLAERQAITHKTEKPLIQNTDPDAKPIFADKALIDKMRALGGVYDGPLNELAKSLSLSTPALHRRVTQAQAAGKLAVRGTQGKGTYIKLIEGT